jgi:hypothetical protein
MKSRIFIILTILSLSCREEDESKLLCSVENPVEDLAWLANQIHEWENSSSDFSHYNYVTKATYGDETIFILGNCCPNCATVWPVFNCTGVEIGQIGSPGFDPEILDRDELVWKPEDSSCTI